MNRTFYNYLKTLAMLCAIAWTSQNRVFAQTLWVNNFDTVGAPLGTGWTTFLENGTINWTRATTLSFTLPVSGGPQSGSGMAFYDSYSQIAPGVAWLRSPAIPTSAITPGNGVVVQFYFLRHANSINSTEARVSVWAGNSLNLNNAILIDSVYAHNTRYPVTTATGWELYRFVVPSSLLSNPDLHIFIRANTDFWNNVFMDSLVIAGVPSMSYISTDVSQAATNQVGIGSTNQRILCAKVATSGLTSPFNATQFTFNTTGTTNVSAITNAKLFYTGNSPVFAPTNQFGSTIANPSGAFTFSGVRTLRGTPASTDTNYFWLTYDISTTAPFPTTFNAALTALTVRDTVRTPVPTTNPGPGRDLALPMSGNYTVGASGTYTTLTQAIGDLNSRGVNGPVNLRLIDPEYSTATGEVFPITISTILGASPTNTITIRPDSLATPLIIDSNSVAMFIIENQKYVSIDGRWPQQNDTSRNLTIQNRSYNVASCVIIMRNEASNITVRNSIIRSSNNVNSTDPTVGAIFVGGTTNLIGQGNDSITISYNTFAPSRQYYSSAITFRGQSLTQQNDWATIDSNRFYGYRIFGVNLSQTNQGNGRLYMIRGNSFYDTVTVIPNPNSFLTFTQSEIYVNSGNANAFGYQIIGNVIGGQSEFGSGPRAILNPGTASIYSIYYNGSNTNSGTIIQSNKVTNAIYNRGGPVNFYYPYHFYVATGFVDILDNVIGDQDDTNSVVYENISSVTMYPFFMFHNAPTTIARNVISNVTVNSNTSVNFVGFYHGATTIGTFNLDSNIISSFFTRSNSTGTFGTSAFCGVQMFNGSASINVRGNIFGGTNPSDSISVFSSAVNSTTSIPANTRIMGIYTTNGIGNYSGNYMGNIYTNSNAGNSTGSHAITGIFISSGTGGSIIRNNTFTEWYTRTATGSTVGVAGIVNTSASAEIRNNTISNFFIQTNNTGTTISAAINGILLSTSQSQIVANNTINNLNVLTLPATNTQINGIQTGVNAAVTVTGNVVSNLRSTTTSTFTGASAGIIGINNSAAAFNQVIDSNFISNLVATNDLGTANASIIGISYNASATVAGNNSQLTRNRIWNLMHTYPTGGTPTGSLIYGIQHNNGTATIANNIIRIGRDTSGNNLLRAGTYRGILISAGSTSQIRVYHNTVAMQVTPDYGTAGAPNPSTGAFELTATSVAPGFVDVRNNIFVNTSSSGGTSTLNHYNEMYQFSTANITTNSNLHFHTQSANSFNGRFAGVNYNLTNINTLRQLFAQAGATGFGDPNFTAPNAIIPDLSIAGPTPIESGGDTTIASFVAIDANGVSRASNGPADLGAISGNFTLSADINAPLIYVTPLVNTVSPANRTLSVTIYDGVQVNQSVQNNPRLYYRKGSANPWRQAIGTLAGGTVKNGTYNFLINHVDSLGGVIPGDTVQYFVIAADTINNLNSNTAYAIAGRTDSLITAPTTLRQYLFNDPIPTTVYVGAGLGTPNYPTLTGTNGLFNAINNSALQGNTQVLVQANVTEPGTIELNRWLEVLGSGYQLTIRPVDNAQYILSGNTATNGGMVRFNNTDNVKILGWSPIGTPNDTNLIIRNSSTTASAVRFVNGGSSDTLQNVILETRNTGTGSTAGSLNIDFNTLTRGVSGLLVDNCYIRQDLTGTTIPAVGFYVQGTSPRLNEFITVNNCKIYNFTLSGVLFTTGTGNNIRITNNHFFYNYGINASTTSMNVININPGNTSNSNVITGNFIGGNTLFAEGSPWVNSANIQFIGINASTGFAAGSTINNNVIQNINMTSTTNTLAFNGILAFGSPARYIINNNRIGSNTLPIISNGNHVFTAINAQGSGNMNIENDTVINIRVLNTGTTARLIGINSINGSANNVVINNNLVSNLFTTSGNTGTLTNGCLVGIGSSNTTLTISITNNTVRSLVTTTVASNTILGIGSLNGVATITGNTVFGLQSRSTATGTLMTAAMLGIMNSSFSAGTYTISNNTVDSLWITNPTPANNQMIGIMNTSTPTSTVIMNGNVVRNLNTESASTLTLTGSPLIGIMQNNSFAVNCQINNNRVSVLNHRRNSASFIVGMYLTVSTSVNGNNSTISGNLVHSLSSSATTVIPTLTGIQYNTGFATITNNMVRMGIDSSGTLYTRPANIRGIWHQGITQSFYYHNSVFLAGLPDSAAVNTFAFDRSVSITVGQQLDMRNNIFANTISNTGSSTGLHYGIVHFDSLRLTSNNNIIHTPGVGGTAARIAQTNTNYTLLGGDSTSWRAVTGLDMISTNANPLFGTNATAAAPNVTLALQNSNPAERGGDATVVVATDYFGATRASNTPSDIGAHAGNFTLSPDAIPPAISYTLLTNAGSLTGTRPLNNVVITDNNGIVMTGANRPRVYYSRDGITWFSSAAITVTGTATNAVANFNIDYLVFSPALTLADTLRYFVVAQDAAGNLQSSPALAVGSDVNTLTQFPRRPNRFNFLPVIAANTVIPVGVGQTYTSLTNIGGVFELINNRTLGGNVVIEVTSDLLGETGAVPLNKFAEDGIGSGTFTLTIRPNASTVTPRLIQGNFQNVSSFNGLITLIGADRVKITGIPTGGSSTQRMLRIRNTATTNTYALNTGNGVIVVSSATGVAITNCIIESGNSNTGGGSIEFRVGVGNQFTTTPCSFDTVSNCILTNNTIATLPDGIPANAGVYSLGNPNVYNNNIVISNNQISNFVTAGIGVVGNNGDGFVITGNSLFYNLGFVPNVTSVIQGIVFLGGSFSSGNTISGNFIGGTAPNATGGNWTNGNNMGFNGIRTQFGNGATSIVSNNTVRNINFTNSASSQQFLGITCELGNTSILNNQVGDPSNINSIQWALQGSVWGIRYNGSQNITLQNNTVQGIQVTTPNTFAQLIGMDVTNGILVGAVTGNTVGHNSTANSMLAAGNTTHIGIRISTNSGLTPSHTFSNNTVANFTATGVGASMTVQGINIANSSSPNVVNNTVHNIRSSSINTSLFGGIASGMNVTTSTNVTGTIANNTIYAIRGTNTGTSPTIVFGLYTAGGQNITYNANRIYDITNASTSTSTNPAPAVAGIGINGGATGHNLTNNQIVLGTGVSNNIQYNGIWVLVNNGTMNIDAYNNSVLIEGTSAAGVQNSYAFIRGNNTGTELVTLVNLTNNIFANRRTGGSGSHFAIANQTSSPTNTAWTVNSSRFNLLVTASTSTVGQWGFGANDIANWRTNSTSDAFSYYMQSGTGVGQLNLNNLFNNPTTGNLNLVTTNAEVWYVFGKGITGSAIEGLSTDFNSNARATVQGFATTIGSSHMTTAPSMLPIAATASAAPAANTTTSYTFASRPVASIAWGASAPTSAVVYDFTGVNPPAPPAGNFNNRYVRVDVTGGTTPYNYGLTYNFNAANLGSTINGNNIRLATAQVAVPTSWTTQFTTTSNASTGIATVAGLSSTGSAITFTGTELTAPPTINAFVPSAAPIGGSVTIRGSLFTGATAVSFNGTPQGTFTVVDDTTITTTVPVGATTGPVSITNAFGTGTSVNNFTIIPAPTISGFTPADGTFGTVVTITGTGFTWATAVRFNGVTTPFTIVNNTTITTTVPVGATSGSIRVVNPADSATSATPFTVFGVPTVTSFTPTSGPVGTAVTITGTDFNAITAVRFNGVNSSFTVNSVTSITATVPAGASTGAISVVNGSGTGVSGTNFTLLTPPTIAAFTPSAGGVGSPVVITGTNFTGADTIWFNTTPTTTFTVNSPTQITVNVPAGATTGLISVRTPQGLAISATAYTVYTDLIVSTITTVSGIYNNITVTSTGNATLTGSLTALGNVLVQTGGVMNFGTEILSGIGNFTAQANSRLVVGSLDGLQTAGISGNIQMNGTRTLSPNVVIEYAGTGNQQTGNLVTNADTIIVNVTSGDLILTTNTAINTRLQFNSGNVRLGANNLTIGATGVIANFSSVNYIITNGNGTLRRTVANTSTNVVYPIGSTTSFTPAQVQLNGTSTTDIISVRVFNGVLANATSGTALATSMVNRTWVISEDVVGGSNAAITLQWNSGDEVGGFNRALSAVSRYNSGMNAWTYGTGTFGAATGSDPYTRSLSGITSLTAFTVGDTFASTLPVSLIAFNGKANGNDAVITWATASEQNNKGFYVERSIDGINFEEVDYKEGKLYSVSRLDYLSTDKNAFDNGSILYYRLRQVDMDGTTTYSEVITVTKVSVTTADVSVFPNPFVSGFSIQINNASEETYAMVISDISGRLVSEKSVTLQAGINTIEVADLESQDAGIYFVKLIGSQTLSVKVVKANK